MKRYLIQLIENSPNRRISYHEFMEAALYAPVLGYYQRSQEKIGKAGDFYTSGNLGDAFGRGLGRWFIHLFKEHGVPLHIMEVGAGSGKLAHDIMQFIKENEPRIWEQLSYTAVETSPFHKQLHMRRMADTKQAVMADNLESISEIKGIIFSNELFDALPVHLIEMTDGVLTEVFITHRHGRFMEERAPLENQEIIQYLDEKKMILQEKQRYEVPLEMIREYRKMAERLASGILLTIDYGYTDEEWKRAEHHRGSLRGYYRHAMTENVLHDPGEKDLTTHIHFDTLIKQGESFGLEQDKLYSQTEFLLKTGLLRELQDHSEADPFSERNIHNRAIRSLVTPGGLSDHFRVLVQMKNVEGKRPLFEM